MKSPALLTRLIPLVSVLGLLILLMSFLFPTWVSLSALSRSFPSLFSSSSPSTLSADARASQEDQHSDDSLSPEEPHLFSEQDQALKKLIYGIFEDAPPTDFEERWLEWTLSSPLSTRYVSREHTDKTIPEWLKLTPYSSNLYPDPALDLAAEEIARFYAQFGRFPPSTLLHFILESVGASVWSIRQRLQSFNRPLSSEQLQKLWTPLPSSPTRIGSAHLYLEDHKTNKKRHYYVLLSAPHRFHLHPSAKSYSLNQEIELAGQLTSAYRDLSAVAFSPVGTFEEVKVMDEGRGNFSIRLPVSKPGKWELELLARGPRGPQPLTQFTFYVNQVPSQTYRQHWPSPSPSASNQELTMEEADRLEQLALKLLNQDRARFLLPPLKLDSHLGFVATGHCEDMKANDFFGHISPQTGSPFDRLKASGYRSLRSGENIAFNRSLIEAEDSLMFSLGHRKNILSPDFTHVGIGVSRKKGGWYLAQVFATPQPTYQPNKQEYYHQKLLKRLKTNVSRSSSIKTRKSRLKGTTQSSPFPLKTHQKLKKVAQSFATQWQQYPSIKVTPKQVLNELRAQGVSGRLSVWIQYTRTLDQINWPKKLNLDSWTHWSSSLGIAPRDSSALAPLQWILILHN